MQDTAPTRVLARSSVVAPEAADRVSPNGTAGIDDDPSLLELYRDLLEPFGEKVDTERLRARRPVFHRDLVEHMVDDRIRATEPDLVVVAHALPDVTPYTPVAAHLATLVGGRATTLGISQQGLSAPFTALRVAEVFRRSGRSARPLVAVLEQTLLPAEHALGPDTPAVDTGALVVLGDGDGSGGNAVLRGSWVLGPGEYPAERLQALAGPDPDGTLLVLGPWLDRDALAGVPGDRLDVAPGSYATSVWLEFAAGVGDGYRRVVLADTDPLSRRSALAVFDQVTA